MPNDQNYDVEYEIIIDEGAIKVVRNKRTVEVTKILPLRIRKDINEIRDNIKKSFFKRIAKLKYKNNIVFDMGNMAGKLILGGEFEENDLLSGYIKEANEVFSRKTILETIKRVCEFDIGDEIVFEILESGVFENINTHRVCVFLKAVVSGCVEIVRLEYAVDDIYEPFSEEFDFSFAKRK